MKTTIVVKVEEAIRRRDAHRANMSEWRGRGIVNAKGEFKYWLHMFNVNVLEAYWMLPWHCPGGLEVPEREIILAWHAIDKLQGFPVSWHEHQSHPLDIMDSCTHWVVLRAATKMAFDAWVAKQRTAALAGIDFTKKEGSITRQRTAHAVLLTHLLPYLIDKTGE